MKYLFESLRIRNIGFGILLLLCTSQWLFAFEPEQYTIPGKIKVRAVFFVAKDQALPTKAQQQKLIRHLRWSQKLYKSLLRNRDTFTIDKTMPLVYKSTHDLNYYRKLPENAAPQIVSELLTYHKSTRFNCPYIFLTVVMNTSDGFPIGGGRPFNGGFNRGGGIVITSSYALENIKNFQSTLRHELGHSFGLPHVDVYGYKMKSNASVMSYNLSHHTNGFKRSQTRPSFIPEDVRGLSFNKRVFEKLYLNGKKDIPEHYSICPRVVYLGAMQIPGKLAYEIKVTSNAGDGYGSLIRNCVSTIIKPSKGPGVTYDAQTMWHSTQTKGLIDIVLEFPLTVTLDSISVHSQHSGLAHIAKGITIETMDHDVLRQIATQDIISPDQTVSFSPATSKKWRLRFKTTNSEVLVIRGLQFYCGNKQIFPPPVPYLFRRRGPGCRRRSTQFEYAKSFSGPLALVRIAGKMGYIDKKGTYVWKPTK